MRKISINLNKFISPIVATTTIAVSTLSFVSIDPAMAAPRVHIVRNCMTYNNAGRELGTFKPGFYPLVKYMKFRNGEDGVQIAIYFPPPRNIFLSVNIASRCLRNSRGRVIEFN